MAKRKGQVVTSTLVTPDTLCTFPVVDVNDVGGGRLIVATTAERNAIPPKFRKEGMVVRVQGSTKIDYELKAGFSATGALTDNDWKEYTTAIPPGVLTEHQKVEDIQYQDPGTSGFATLILKLQDMDTKIAGCLTSHQKVENMLFQTPVPITGGNTSSLVAKLADMDSKINSAAAIPDIENINWGTVPSDGHPHQSSLAGELEKIYTDMNDPTKITVTKTDSTTTDLQTLLNALQTKVPKVEEISNTSGTPLTTLLADASDVTKIRWNVTQSLKDKIDSMDTAISGVTVEDIDWGTTPTSVAGGLARNVHLKDEINLLFTTIADMNKDTEIMVKSASSVANPDVTLRAKLASIDSAITAAGLTPNIESIKWGTTPASVAGGLTRDQDLEDELNTLFGAVNTINTTIADMNDPTKIIVENVGGVDVNLSTKLSQLSSAHDKVEDIVWNTTPTSVTGGLARNASLSSELNTLFTGIKNINDVLNDPDEIIVLANPNTVGDTVTTTLSNKLKSLDSIAAAPTVETIKWNTTPASVAGGIARDQDLSDELNNLFAKMPDMNKAALINVLANPTTSGDTTTTDLQNKLTALQTAIETIEIPQYLLYNTSAPETGSLTSQEFLTTYASKICEIAVYTNSDATITGDITVTLEKCESNSTTYTAVSGTSVTLNTSDAGLMDRVDLSGLSTPITLPDNCRLRINITSYNTANVVDVLNVRVKLVQNI